MMSFKELNIDDFNCNPFSKIGKDWMLISSGTADARENYQCGKGTN